MAGFLGCVPIYLNGLLALFCVFVVPGLVFARAFAIPDFPQRWFVVFLSSVTFNHLLVSLIAAFHLNPLTTYRAAIVAIIAILVVAAWRGRAGSETSAYRDASIARWSDIVWLLLSLTVLCFSYVNVWKHGVPNIFDDGDVSASWNTWSLIWSQGKFPVFSNGYPQFVPTIWAVTYIFTGSTEQYFAFYIYIVLIIAPIVLNAMNLGRVSWWHPLLPGFVFVWLVAEIREPWLRGTLQEGYPDWVAAISGFCGVVLFISNAPEGRFDRAKIITALVSLCLVSIAAATKPIYGLFAVAILIGMCADAAGHLDRNERIKFFAASTGLLSMFVVAYVLNYSHLVTRSMPNYPVSELSERLLRAFHLFNSNFTLPFRILILAGVILSPFLRRIRWLALPLLAGSWLWASTASYDLRNLLGLLLISAFIALYAAARAMLAARVIPNEPQVRVPDGAVAASLAILSVGLTLTLATGDSELKERFAGEQLRRGPGHEINQKVGEILRQGCTVFSGNAYIFTVAAFQPGRDQLRYFAFSEPLHDLSLGRLTETAGCTGILFPPDRTHPSILAFIATNTEARGYRKIAEGNGATLLVSNMGAPGTN
jgi:hypothetical protein